MGCSLIFFGVPTGCSPNYFFGHWQAVRIIPVWDDVPKINLMEKVLLYASLYHKSFHFATSLLSFLYFAGICGIMGQNFFLGGLLCGLRLTNTGFICL